MKRFIIIIAILFAFSQPLTAETDPNNPAVTDEQAHHACPNIPSDHIKQTAPGEQKIPPGLEAKITQAALEKAETYYDNKFDSLQFSLAIYVTIFLAMGAILGIVIGVVVPFVIENKRGKEFKELTLKIDNQKADLQTQIVKEIEEAGKTILKIVSDATAQKIAQAEEKLQEYNDKVVEDIQSRNAISLRRVFCGLALAFNDAPNSSLASVFCLNAVYHYLIAKNYKPAESLISNTFKRLKSIKVNVSPEDFWSGTKDLAEKIESDCDLKDHPEIKKIAEEISQLAAHHLYLIKKSADEKAKAKPETKPDTKPKANPS